MMGQMSPRRAALIIGATLLMCGAFLNQQIFGSSRSKNPIQKQVRSAAWSRPEPGFLDMLLTTPTPSTAAAPAAAPAVTTATTTTTIPTAATDGVLSTTSSASSSTLTSASTASDALIAPYSTSPPVSAANVPEPHLRERDRRRIIIVTMGSKNQMGYYEPAMRVKRAYAARHGYEVFTANVDFVTQGVGRDGKLVRNVTFKKVDVLRELLADAGLRARFDYIFWSDADMLVMNGNVRLESFLYNSQSKRFGGDGAGARHEYDLIMTDHSAALNNGGFFLRVSDWSRDFVDRWHKLSHVGHKWPFTDNGSILPVLLHGLLPPAEDGTGGYSLADGKGGACVPRLQPNLTVTPGTQESRALLKCFQDWMERGDMPYGHRESAHVWLVPATHGFNNHAWENRMSGWGWNKSDTHDFERHMFMLHTKKLKKFAAESNELNHWY